MTVGRDIGVDVEVVGDGEGAGQLEVVGHDHGVHDLGGAGVVGEGRVSPVSGQRRIALSNLDLAEDLVVGPVFLGDEDNVLDRRCPLPTVERNRVCSAPGKTV